jgi:2-aminoethylphosphonate-pyruvate transaminase
MSFTFALGQKLMDKLLFTPGPLTTSKTVKQAMLRDLGSRDEEFIAIVKGIRQKLLGLAGVSQETGYEAILMQGSGTFGVESVIVTAVPRGGHLLVISNGAYGERMLKIAEQAGIKNSALRFSEEEAPSASDVAERLASDSTITHVAVVHCETTTGIFNPIEQIGQAVKKAGRVFIVDAMSSFGAVPINVADCGIDYLVSSSNKCIEGVPGFSFAIARRKLLAETSGNSRSLSLDLHAQWQGLETTSQFRFTPPTHAIIAFHQALDELEQEGGPTGRANRYQSNYQKLIAGMKQLGFREYLRPENQGYIITAFHYPADPNFDFRRFYQLLNQRGFVIYPGKLSQIDCFRIGSIGRIKVDDVQNLLAAIKDVLAELGIDPTSSEHKLKPHIHRPRMTVAK